MPQTTGQFSIDLTPGDALHAGIGRFDFTKSWTGGLDGASSGTMLSAGDPGSGTAGYIAMEVFTGGLDGNEGSFVLQQFGTMLGGEASMTYVVTPGSGTGELAGLTGTVHLEVVEGVHRLRFEYEL